MNNIIVNANGLCDEAAGEMIESFMQSLVEDKIIHSFIFAPANAKSTYPKKEDFQDDAPTERVGIPEDLSGSLMQCPSCLEIVPILRKCLDCGHEWEA